ncbi:AmmeMemoRadiSam system protein A [Fonticella tunisiensis]|uniref:AMMECR1 domain-containing protein n=1 Tax=Fonticella tunisiensis TaxID=1096341 RepID=A0A4R7K9W2_9CLOT|nr:AmmeMemoRadiSam system protein A [Fonticella tunisiensis]TDT50391.1 hypothetical protein EDD71_1296 [Fonticella tunisiensis]
MGKILGYYVMPHPPIIIPEIGKGEEYKAEKTIRALEKAADEIKELKPEIIIIITPHGPLFRDAISISNVPSIKGDFRRFGAPHVKLNMNISMHLTENIIRHADEMNISVVPLGKNSVREYDVLCELDHGAAVPLYYINKVYRDFQIVHIVYGLLHKIDLYRFGMAIKRAVEEDDFSVVLIASGDLSHRLRDEGPYEYNPRGEEFDREIIKLLERVDTKGIFNMNKDLIEDAGECGMRSFYIMLGAMEGYFVKGQTLSYEGPFGVGYGVLRFEVQKEAEERQFLEDLKAIRQRELEERRKNEDVYVRLARESLEHYINEGEYLKIPDYIPASMLKEKRAVFVSLKKDGELRGCIGTIYPITDNVAEEIIRNAVEAGVNDPRFYPVGRDELVDIDYSVDVLMPPVKTSKEDLNPKRYGVIVRKGNRAGVLLPDLEGVDTVDEQISIALKKAGISEDEEYEIERFEVVRHS